jgi:hypothetical protein
MVGYQGQRYEIRAKWKHNGKEFVVGWTNRPDGGGVLKMAQKHPNMRGAYVVDREARRSNDIIMGTRGQS